LIHRANYVDAEALLLDAERVVRAAPFIPPDLRHDTVESLASLYATWAKTDPSKAVLAAEWKEKLEALNRAEPGKKTAPVSAEGAK
jgi:hypothetical protein